MSPQDIQDSMPNLPPPAGSEQRLLRGEPVVCVDAKGCELAELAVYEIDADYGDVKGRQMVYLKGYPDNCPFSAARFVRLADWPVATAPSENLKVLMRGNAANEFAEVGMLAVDLMTATDKAALTNILTANDRGLPGEDKAIQAGDEVNLPSHYARFKIEPIRFLVENFGPSILVGKIVKYSMRYDGKNGLQDIDKAIRCAQMLRAYVAGDPDWWQRKAA